MPSDGEPSLLGERFDFGLDRFPFVPRCWRQPAGCDRPQELAAEVAALEADEQDRREMLEVAGFMEALRAAG